MPPEFKPVPSVAPEDRPTPRVGIEFGRIHFTEAIGSAIGELGKGSQVLGGATQSVGAALASLGQSFERAGNEVWNRAVAIKEVENSTAATEAETKYMMLSAQQDVAFQAQGGNAASQGLEAHMKGLDNLRQQIRSTLPNQDAQHKYDHQSLLTMGNAVWRAAKHAKEQGKAAALGAEKSKSDMEAVDIVNHARDQTDEQFDDRIKGLMKRWEEREAPLEDLGKGPQLEQARQQRLSKYLSARIDGVGKDDPLRGLDLLDKWQDKNWIRPDAAEALRGKLGDRYRHITIRNKADKLFDYLNKPKTQEEREKEPTYEDTLQKGLDEIKDDPRLKKDPFAVNEWITVAESTWGKVDKARRAQDKRETESLESAASGFDRDDIPKPTTREELFARNPALEPMWNNATTAEKRRLDDRVYRNFKEDFALTRENDEQYWKLKMMADDPQFRNEFLSFDIHNWKAPFERKRELYNKQQQVYTKPGEPDPRLSHAESFLRGIPGMVPAAIDKAMNPEGYKTWSSALMRAIITYQSVTGTHAGPKELEAIGNSIKQEMKNTAKERWFSGIWNRGDIPWYEVAPSLIDEKKKQFPGITDEQARDKAIEEYMTIMAPKIFHDLYGQRAKPGALGTMPQPKKPTPAEIPSVPGAQ